MVGYASSALGLGEDLRQAARAFVARGVPIHIYDIEIAGKGVVPSDLKRFCDASHPHPITIFFMSPFSLNEWYEHHEDVFKGTYKIGNFLWELEDFPGHWLPTLSRVDEIWVPTRFVRDIYTKAGVSQVYLNPTPAVPIPNRPVSYREKFGFAEKTFVFGFMFDLHSTLTRKNPLGLVKAYEKSKLLVPWTRETALLIKVHRSDVYSKELIELKNVASKVKGVLVVEETLDADDVVGFYNTLDAYVSLHRSEGLGRTLIEAAQLGVPTVCTAYSGSGDIVELSEVQGVPSTKVACHPSDYPYCDGSIWAEPSVDCAAVLMARLAKLGRRRLSAPVRLNEYFSANAFVDRSLQRFEKIQIN